MKVVSEHTANKDQHRWWALLDRRSRLFCLLLIRMPKRNDKSQFWILHNNAVHTCIHTAYSLGFWWFNFKLKPIFTIGPVASKNGACFKNGQYWLENNYLLCLEFNRENSLLVISDRLTFTWLMICSVSATNSSLSQTI